MTVATPLDSVLSQQQSSQQQSRLSLHLIAVYTNTRIRCIYIFRVASFDILRAVPCDRDEYRRPLVVGSARSSAPPPLPNFDAEPTRKPRIGLVPIYFGSGAHQILRIGVGLAGASVVLASSSSPRPVSEARMPFCGTPERCCCSCDVGRSSFPSALKRRKTRRTAIERSLWRTWRKSYAVGGWEPVVYQA